MQDGTKKGSTSCESYIYTYLNNVSQGNSHGGVWLTNSEHNRSYDIHVNDIISFKGYSGADSDSSQGYMCMYIEQ